MKNVQTIKAIDRNGTPGKPLKGWGVQASLCPEYLQALQMLENLNELSLQLLGIINISDTEDILTLMAKRQELVDELCQLDIFKRKNLAGDATPIPPIIHNEFSKLLTAGEVLIKCCNQRLKDLETFGQQGANTYATEDDRRNNRAARSARYAVNT